MIWADSVVFWHCAGLAAKRWYILHFMGYMISVATIQPDYGTVEAATDNTETKGHGSVPIKLYWQENCYSFADDGEI